MEHLKNVTAKVLYVPKLLYLFTASDLIPTILPVATFGVLAALSGPILTTSQDPNHLHVISRAPLILLFVWCNVLIFNISNQCLSSSILEDRLNKPWRPVPSGFVTVRSGRRLLFVLAPVVLVLSWLVGGQVETLICFALSWLYNEQHGGDKSFVARNLLVAALYVAALIGALKVGCGAGETVQPRGYSWVFTVASAVFTTMHVSDFHDMDGDAAKRRRTVPIILGERLARWSIVIAILFWSLVGILYWQPQLFFQLVLVLSGLLVVIRQLLYRGRMEDRRTWLCWAWWTICLYALPLSAQRVL